VCVCGGRRKGLTGTKKGGSHATRRQQEAEERRREREKENEQKKGRVFFASSWRRDATKREEGRGQRKGTGTQGITSFGAWDHAMGSDRGDIYMLLDGKIGPDVLFARRFVLFCEDVRKDERKEKRDQGVK